MLTSVLKTFTNRVLLILGVRGHAPPASAPDLIYVDFIGTLAPVSNIENDLNFGQYHVSR